MKLAMKLRTRLFVSISALITVALLGLVLGLVSVMQMANTQEQSVRDNFVLLDLGLKLRKSLGDQLMIMLDDKPNLAALEQSRQQYLALIDEGIAHEQGLDDAPGSFSKAKADYIDFYEAYTASRQQPSQLTSVKDLTENSTCCAMG